VFHNNNNNNNIYIFFSDAQRALQLLEEYRTKLSQTGDPHLRLSIERVIDIFQSTLFHALIGKLLLEQPIFSLRKFLSILSCVLKWWNRFDFLCLTSSVVCYSSIVFFILFNCK